MTDLLDSSLFSSLVDTTIANMDNTQDIGRAGGSDLLTNRITCCSNRPCLIYEKGAHTTCEQCNTKECYSSKRHDFFHDIFIYMPMNSQIRR